MSRWRLDLLVLAAHLGGALADDDARQKILSVLAAQVATQIKLRTQYRELRRISGELERKSPCWWTGYVS